MFFTGRQAAVSLGVSVSLVYGLVATGRLRHERIGLGRGVIRIPEEALVEYRRSCTVGAGVQPPASTLAAQIRGGDKPHT